MNTYRLRFITASLLVLAALGLVACGGETTTTVVETVVVEKEVVVEVEKEVIKEVEKVVEKEVVVVATAAAYGSGPGSRAFAEPQAPEAPKQRSGTLIVEAPRLS